jgi:hypothetical protein
MKVELLCLDSAVKESGQVLPHPGAIFHAYASTDTPWVAWTLSHYTPVKRGKASSNSSTHEATQFRDSICPVCVSTFQIRVHSDPTDGGLNQHRRGVTTFELWISDQTTLLPSHLVFSIFPKLPHPVSNYVILPTIQVFNILISNQGIKALNLVSGVSHSTSAKVLSTMHSITNGFSTTIGARWYTKGIMCSRASFNSYNIYAQVNNNLRMVIK